MENFHLFKIKYIGPSNYSGSKIKITSERWNQSVKIKSTTKFNTSVEEAVAYLESIGYPIAGKCSGNRTDHDYCFSEEFKALKESSGGSTKDWMKNLGY